MFHGNLLENTNFLNDSSKIDKYYLNEADIQVLLLDLDNKLYKQNQYFDQRDRLINEIKTSRNNPTKLGD